MTTAHRPTFDPARGKEAQRGPAYHQRLLPAHTVLKHRQEGQGTQSETGQRDLRAELLAAEAAYYAKKQGSSSAITDADGSGASAAPKRTLEAASLDSKPTEDDPEAKRRRLILEEAAELDADSSGSDSDDDNSDSEEDDDDDEEAELMRELEKIKRERAEQKARDDAAQAATINEQREVDIARGNPLLNSRDYTMKRRWDEDVVFKNQARGQDDKKPKEFVNDLLRSDFHKRFMGRYVR